MLIAYEWILSCCFFNMMPSSFLGENSKPEAEKMLRTHSTENSRWVANHKVANKTVNGTKT